MEREIEEEVKQNWWQILVFAAMFLALAIVLLILLRTRSELAKKVVKGATGMLKGVTRPLSAASKQTPGKLVIQQGANIGREYRIGAQVVKVGRDPQFSDFALFDDFVSNPHFSIHMEGMQFYITDEGSTNGTRLNGIALPPHQRTPLAPDAVIEVGQIRLQFKQIGLATRPLEERAAGRPAGAGPPVPPVGTPSPGPYATRPVSETPAPSAQPSPYATRPVQETPASAAPSPYATRKVEDTPDEDVPPNPYATRKVKD
jgi:pSer/pThr/pTyr-binding forkhead associated (FHA) protein